MATQAATEELTPEERAKELTSWMTDRYSLRLTQADPTRYELLDCAGDESVVVCSGQVPYGDGGIARQPHPAADIEREIVNALGNVELDIPIFNGAFSSWADEASSLVEEIMDARKATRLGLLKTDGWQAAASVTPRLVEFLPGWEPYIAVGHQSALGGDPGVGKSTLGFAIAAQVSHLGRNVVILSAEDDHETKIVPMLAKLGANLDRCIVMPIEKVEVFNESGLAKLDRALEEFDPLLVIIDPMTYFLGGKVDMHRANEVRDVMTELSSRAAKHRSAIVSLMHLNKGSGKALYRFLGSIDFSAGPRSGMLVGKIDDAPERGRVILHAKSNLGELAEPRGFDLIHEPDDPYKLPRFEWRETDITQAEFEQGSPVGRKPTQIKLAKAMIVGMLKHGPLDSNVVKSALDGAGISEATQRRARQDTVDIEQAHPGGGGSKSIWKLKPLAAVGNEMTPEMQALAKSLEQVSS